MYPQNLSSFTSFAASCTLLLAFAGASNAATVITATDGNVKTAGEQLGQNDVVNSSDVIEVEGNGIASLMVADSAIVKMCHGAALGFSDDQGSGPSSLNLRTGQLKVTAGRRPADDPLEIHTPTAIATLLGTEVHVDVDPTNGDTTITALDHQIRVNSIDSPDTDGVVISPGESVTVRRGAQPEAIQTADVAAIVTTSNCLDEGRFRVAAVSAARRSYGKQSINQIAAMDMESDLPTVAAGAPVIPTGTMSPATVPSCLSAIQCAGPVAASTGPRFVRSTGVTDGTPGPP